MLVQDGPLRSPQLRSASSLPCVRCGPVLAWSMSNCSTEPIYSERLPTLAQFDLETGSSLLSDEVSDDRRQRQPGAWWLHCVAKDSRSGGHSASGALPRPTERRHHVSTVALPDQSPRLDHGRLRSKSPGCDSQVLPVWGSTREEQLRRIRIVEEAGARRLRPPSHVPRRLTSSRYPDRAADSLEVLQQKAGASVDAALGAPRAAQPQREPGRHRRSIGLACHIGGRRIGPPSGRRVSNRTAAIPGGHSWATKLGRERSLTAKSLRVEGRRWT